LPLSVSSRTNDEWTTGFSACNLLLRKGAMLWTIFVILLILWLFGLITSYTFGGFIHILLIVAIAILLIHLISGRRAV
jgi:hypothetical protein